MGIFKATKSAFSGTGNDAWKEFFYCNSIPNDTLMVRGVRSTGTRSANNGSSEIISDGSVVAIADGQMAILVNGGKVTNIFTEPGENVIESGATPSIWTKGGAKATFKDSINRIGFGGDLPGKTQRIYYFNTKLITGNFFDVRFSTPFKILDDDSRSIDCVVHIAGSFSFRITKPEITYKKLMGNVTTEYKKDLIVGQIKAEMGHIIQSRAAEEIGGSIRASELPSKIGAFQSAIRSAYREFLEETRGITIETIDFNVFSIEERDLNFFSTAQRNTLLGADAEYRKAFIVTATADSMQTAADNSGGVMIDRSLGEGILTEGNGTSSIVTEENTTDKNNADRNTTDINIADRNIAEISEGNRWVCACGSENTSKFCMECGAKRDVSNWICRCGARNKGKFCMECGNKR